MEVIKYPSKADWPSLVKRPALDVTTLFDTVRTVLNEVRGEGDTAVKRYEEKFDKVTLSGLQVSEEEIKEAVKNSDFHDFEDCLQDKCAVHANAEYIVTCNAKDFQLAKTKIVTPDVFVNIITEERSKT